MEMWRRGAGVRGCDGSLHLDGSDSHQATSLCLSAGDRVPMAQAEHADCGDEHGHHRQAGSVDHRRADDRRGSVRLTGPVDTRSLFRAGVVVATLQSDAAAGFALRTATGESFTARVFRFVVAAGLPRLLAALDAIGAGTDEVLGTARGAVTAAEARCAAVVTDAPHTREPRGVTLIVTTRLAGASAPNADRAAAHGRDTLESGTATISGTTELPLAATSASRRRRPRREQQGHTRGDDLNDSKAMPSHRSPSIVAAPISNRAAASTDASADFRSGLRRNAPGQERERCSSVEYLDGEPRPAAVAFPLVLFQSAEGAKTSEASPTGFEPVLPT